MSLAEELRRELGVEPELIKGDNGVLDVFADVLRFYERQARDFLIKESQETLHDRVSRAYGILRTAQTISSEETMHLLSSLRMGVNLGLIRDVPIPTRPSCRIVMRLIKIWLVSGLVPTRRCAPLLFVAKVH